MNYKKLNRHARLEAYNNDVPFTYYYCGGRIRHNSAIVEAIAARRQFSYIK
jgi:hypothetical protein